MPESEHPGAMMSDCLSGQGKLVRLQMDGSYDNEFDYVAKGESVASGIADTICFIYKSALDEQQSKSI